MANVLHLHEFKIFNISGAREGFEGCLRKSVTWVSCICKMFNIPGAREGFGGVLRHSVTCNICVFPDSSNASG